ncbi:MAG: flagellar biosynthesis protein FlgD [Actinobacteria bacterium]|nr:flagellar biosynthesis protein FlgD [Actinomycetota bacterium]
MQVSSVDNSSAASALSSAPANQDLDKDAFLQLLVTQLKNQDPLSPMDNTAFVAQLAQFSSLEQLSNMNSSLQSSALVTQSMNNSVMAGLIGKNIRATDNTLNLEAGSPAGFAYQLKQGANVQVEVYSSTGERIRKINFGLQAEGVHNGVWDGKNNSGQDMPAGKYYFSISASDAEGNSIPTSPIVEGKVTGIRFVDGKTYIMLGNTEIDPTNIIDISETSGI